MIERLKVRVAPETVSKPEGTENIGTGDIDYAGIVAEENKRKD